MAKKNQTERDNERLTEDNADLRAIIVALHPDVADDDGVTALLEDDDNWSRSGKFVGKLPERTDDGDDDDDDGEDGDGDDGKPDAKSGRKSGKSEGKGDDDSDGSDGDTSKPGSRSRRRGRPRGPSGNGKRDPLAIDYSKLDGSGDGSGDDAFYEAFATAELGD